MNKLKLAVGIMLVFLVGALGGSLGTGLYFKQYTRRFESGGPPMSERVQLLSRRFARELDLTQEQREELEKIVRESQEKIMALGRKAFPEIEKIDEESFALMKEKLTSEQKEKLDRLYQGMKEFRGRFPDQSASPPMSREPGPSRRSYEGFINEMKERLDLSREQETKVKEILEERDRERERIMGKPDEREMGEIEKDFEEELSEILTAEQLEKYKELQKDKKFNNGFIRNSLITPDPRD